VSDIESAVRTRANSATASPEHPQMPTEECVNTWRKELNGILSFFDVRRCFLTAPVPHHLNQVSQGVSKRGSSLDSSAVPEHVQEHLDSESELDSAPTPLVARCFVFSAQRSLLTQCSSRQLRLLPDIWDRQTQVLTNALTSPRPSIPLYLGYTTKGT
jgi:hypothetical protein